MSRIDFDAIHVAKLAAAVQERGQINLPDGTSIHRGPVGGFVTRSRGGQMLKHHFSARDAAKHALDMSAQSIHPKSIGGIKRLSISERVSTDD